MSLRRALGGAWHWLPLWPALLLLAVAPPLGLSVRERAPAVRYAEGIEVAAGDAPVVLGYEALYQHPGPRSAAREHLRVEKTPGGWRIGNSSSERRVFVRGSGVRSRYVQRWPLAAGDRFSAPEAEFAVREAGPDRLSIEELGSGRTVVWNDGVMEAAGERIHLVCRSSWSRFVERARWSFRNLNGRQRPEFELFTLGGGLNCSNRWRHPALPPLALSVRWHDGRFWLAPGVLRDDVLMRRAGDRRDTAFSDLRLPVDGPEGRVTAIILGSTQYRVDVPDDHLRLTPVAGVELWPADLEMSGGSRRLAWIGGGRRAHAWLRQQWRALLPAAAAALLSIAFAASRHRRRRDARLRDLLARSLGLAPALVGAYATLLLYRGRGEPDLMLIAGMVWLAWAWATLMLTLTGRLRGSAGWVWVIAGCFALTGTVVLLQLGAGAQNTRWLGYVQKHAALLALFGWSVSAACAVSAAQWRRLWIVLFSSEGIAAAVAAVLVVLMLLQLALGGEEGIAGVQPVEPTKSVFVVLLAYVGMHFAEVRARETRAYRRSPLRILLPYLRFAAIFGVVVLSLIVGVRDFSPLIILGVATLAFAWRLGGRVEGRRGRLIWWLPRPSVLAAVVGLAAAGSWAYQHAEQLPDDMPQKDRILVWAQPALHPHSGSQVLAAMDRVGEGGWTGELAWFGPNGDVMNVPAVQDDFITAFLLNRFGALTGLAFLSAQLAYLVLLFSLARRVERRTEEADYREQEARRVLGYTLYGLAWLQIAHWTIAWCNTLGLLPVMGQPMTWLSAGNSHLVGFALFTLSVALVTGWTLAAPAPARTGR